MEDLLKEVDGSVKPDVLVSRGPRTFKYRGLGMGGLDPPTEGAGGVEDRTHE